MIRTKIWLIIFFLLFVTFPVIYSAESRAEKNLPKLPDEVYFAGQRIDLTDKKIRERVEQEFFNLLMDKETFLVVMRMGKYFAIFEKELSDNGLSKDFKYMTLVESNLKIDAYSSAEAAGLWQFIPATGRRFGLKINKVVDERYDPYLSTEAAALYLKELLKKFNNDIFLAMAGWNAGENNISEALKQQQVNDFWSLYYKNETMRFIPRIIAAKIIFSDTEKYFGLSADDLYKPSAGWEEKTIEIKEKSKSLIKIAKENNTILLELKNLNPQIRSNYLPNGKYKLRFPK